MDDSYSGAHVSFALVSRLSRFVLGQSHLISSCDQSVPAYLNHDLQSVLANGAVS